MQVGSYPHTTSPASLGQPNHRLKRKKIKMKNAKETLTKIVVQKFYDGEYADEYVEFLENKLAECDDENEADTITEALSGVHSEYCMDEFCDIILAKLEDEVK